MPASQRCLRILLVLLAGTLSMAHAGTTAIRFGKLIDGTGQVLTDAVVVVEGERVVSVGTDRKAVPAGAAVIDLTRYTGIPGMIDAHTHMTYYWDQLPGTRPFFESDDRMPAVTVFLAQENARKTLEAGVTTVRDLGAIGYTDIAMRDLIARGAMLGPRMFVAGVGLRVNPGPPSPGVDPAAYGIADGVPDVLKMVRRQIGAGADCIKMYASTGSDQDVTGYQTFTFEEMKAAVDVTHKYGKKIAIHSYGPDAARDAVRAGADSLEHTVDLDDETLAEMVRRGTFYVPTIDHNRYYVENRAAFGFSADVAAKLDAFREKNLETARRAIKAGVRIAMGSDALFTMFGQNTRELEWLVKAGMTPEQALAAATADGAALLGMEKNLGAVAPGYYADIVAVEGDPRADIGVVVHGVRWVMKGGAVVVDGTTEPAKK